ncbi:hypothetical protein HY994_06325 [Candidatus Micrarchaeota archaeon]|nr:hypothetical protein [Candidatus Micrarchaeota archaeon]
MRLSVPGRYRGRRLLFVHYNQRIPASHPSEQNLHPEEGREYDDSAFHQTLDLISQRGYRPQDHVAAFNHLNTNIVLSLFVLAHPEMVSNLSETQKKRIKQACLFTENRARTTTGGQNLYFGIKAVTDKAQKKWFPDHQGRPTEEQTNVIAHALVFGEFRGEIHALLKNPNYGNYSRATRQFIQRGKRALRGRRTLRTDHEIGLESGGKINVTFFKNPSYLHPLSGFPLARDSHVVVRESNDTNRYVVFDVQPVDGQRVHFPKAFYDEFREVERENWKNAGRDLDAYEKDLPGGRGNAGGTSRNHDAELSHEQLLELIRKHAVMRRG